MTGRNWRHIVSQLRAKADSTTFPTEAHALRARADELERAHRLDVAEPAGDFDEVLEQLRQSTGPSPGVTDLGLIGEAIRLAAHFSTSNVR